MPAHPADSSTDDSRKHALNKQASTWLTLEQVERIRNARLSEAFPTYLQGRNQTIITLLADTGLRVSELVALDWEYLDLDAEPGELYLPSGIQKGNPGASYLDLADETRRQLRRYQNRVWKDSEALFPSRQSERMTARSVRNVVTRAAEEASVRPYRIEGGRGKSHEVSPHTFRHSIAFRMILRTPNSHYCNVEIIRRTTEITFYSAFLRRFKSCRATSPTTRQKSFLESYRSCCNEKLFAKSAIVERAVGEPIP
jgi:integrase